MRGAAGMGEGHVGEAGVRRLVWDAWHNSTRFPEYQQAVYWTWMPLSLCLPPPPRPLLPQPPPLHPLSLSLIYLSIQASTFFPFSFLTLPWFIFFSYTYIFFFPSSVFYTYIISFKTTIFISSKIFPFSSLISLKSLSFLHLSCIFFHFHVFTFLVCLVTLKFYHLCDISLSIFLATITRLSNPYLYCSFLHLTYVSFPYNYLHSVPLSSIKSITNLHFFPY